MSGPLSGRSHGACSARVISACAQAGVTILLVSIALWLILTWLGWSLVFAASANAVVDATTAAPATIGQRVYFAGYTLLTLGNGD